MSLSGRIKIGMMMQGISSPAELASRLHLNRQTVHKWLSGEVSAIEPEHLFKLAELLEVDPKWLATQKGDPQPPERVTPELRQLIATYNALGERDQRLLQKHGTSMLEETGKTSPAQPFKQQPTEKQK